MSAALLQIRDVDVFYGRTHAVRGVELDVGEGTVVALIGANGAGKTSLLRAISGLVPIRSGSARFGGVELRGLSPDRIARLGLAHAPEGRRVFARMSVAENLAMGAYLVAAAGEIHRRLDGVLKRFPRLAERRGQLAGFLSGGEQQMLAIGRALMAQPRLLLLDEPSMGLAPLVVEEIFGVIADLKREGRTILLVEQNARAALRAADRAYVLETGRIVVSGPADRIADDPAVVAAYLGG